MEVSNRMVTRPWPDTVPLPYPQRLWPSEPPTTGGRGAGTANPSPVFHTLGSPGPPTATGWSQGPRPSASFLPQSEHKLAGVKEANGGGREGYPRGAPQGLRLGKREPVPLRRSSLGLPNWQSCFALRPSWAWFWPLAFATCTPSVAASRHGCPSGSLPEMLLPRATVVRQGMSGRSRGTGVVGLEPNTAGSLPPWVAREQSCEQPAVPGPSAASSDPVG